MSPLLVAGDHRHARCCTPSRWRSALLRLLRGPRAQDRVLALDFLYVVGMLMMLVLAIRYDSRCTSRRRC